MRNLLKEKGIKIIESITPIIPIFTYDDLTTFKACVMLQQKGVYVNPVISPAVPVGQSLLRTSYTATHTEEQMNKTADAIYETLKALNCIK